MSGEEYSLKEIIDRNHLEVVSKLGTIDEKVSKTNGRVKRLELWRSLLIGAWGTFALFELPRLIEFLHK